jgi:hypothetical protein
MVIPRFIAAYLVVRKMSAEKQAGIFPLFRHSGVTARCMSQRRDSRAGAL